KRVGSPTSGPPAAPFGTRHSPTPDALPTQLVLRRRVHLKRMLRPSLEMDANHSRRCQQSFLQTQTSVANPALHPAQRLPPCGRNLCVAQTLEVRQLDS